MICLSMATDVWLQAEENKMVYLPFLTVKFKQKDLDGPSSVLRFYAKICQELKPDLISGTTQEQQESDQSLNYLPEMWQATVQRS